MGLAHIPVQGMRTKRLQMRTMTHGQIAWQVCVCQALIDLYSGYALVRADKLQIGVCRSNSIGCGCKAMAARQQHKSVGASSPEAAV